MRANKPPKKVPNFASREEEARFWEDNDSSEFELGDEVTVTVEPQAKTKMISIRVSVLLLETYKRIAAAANIPYQRLMKEVLERYAVSNGRVGGLPPSQTQKNSLSPAQNELLSRARCRTEAGGAQLPRAA